MSLSRSFYLSLLLMCAVTCGLCPALGWAAPPGAALRKFEEGSKAFAAGSYDPALKAFLASMELEPSPNTRFKIAKCYVALGKTASAYVAFKRAAQEAQDRVNATGEKRFLPTRDAALIEAAALESKVPKLTLVVPSDVPEGFVLTLDGSPLPQSLWALAVETDPGTHQIVAEGARLKRFSLTVELHQGEFRRIDIPFVRVATATLRFSFASKPAGLAVSIDKQPVSPELFDRPQFVDIGPHRVVVSAPGHRSFVWSRSLSDNEAVLIPVVLEASLGVGAGVPKVAVYVLGGATLAALAVGIGFGMKAKNTADEQLALDPLERSVQVQDSVRTDAILANVTLGVAGGLALTTGVLAALARWRTPEAGLALRTSVSIAPVVSAQSALLMVSGRY
jgi:hypothetical protein